MFGHKNDQTTVGSPTVQNPSMLDNVSSQDFDGDTGAVNDVQHQVQQALDNQELNKVKATLANTSTQAPIADDTHPFMASPSASPIASDPAVATTAVPADNSAADDDTPQPEAVEGEPVQDDIPHPLTAEEDDTADNAPAMPSTPQVEPPSEQEAADSPSAPVSPPPVVIAPPADEVAKTDSGETVSAPDAEATVEAAKSESDTEPTESESTEPAENTAETTEEKSEPEAQEDTPAESEEPEETPAEDAASTETKVEEETSAPKEDAKEEEPTAESSEPADSEESSAVPAVDAEKLAGMKDHALKHLDEVADKLDQSPQDEFKTTMMRIQANDNHTLLEKALNAAKNIEDDKARAKAMLDVINEINYFSQGATESTPSETDESVEDAAL